jgi:hypothetical protein
MLRSERKFVCLQDSFNSIIIFQKNKKNNNSNKIKKIRELARAVGLKLKIDQDSDN